MPLEVKATYHKEALKKALKQIRGAVEFIDEWVGGDLTEECGWRYIPAICFDSQIENIEEKICAESIKFILHGDKIDEQVKKMFEGIPTGHEPLNYMNKRLAEFFL